MFENIPHELRALPHWVCAGRNKEPLDPKTGKAASVTDPTTWGTFETAASCHGYPVGFVLTEDDPFCVIDLDDPATVKIDGQVFPNPDGEEVARIAERHQRILAAFETYAEISQSGNGVHIVCRAKVPQGTRREKVEIYSALRHMIFTGRVVKPLPVTDQQPLVDLLFAELSRDRLSGAELVQVDGHLSDDELFQMASRAANADKFMQLWEGNWRNDYESQSEADFALLSMLGFYSLDNEQVRRVFRWSALGQREKATKNDRYLNYALSKIRAKLPPPVNFDALISRGENEIATTQPAEVATVESVDETPEPEAVQPAPKNETEIELPPGFVGEAASYIYSAAIRPVPEIALAAAIALTAGVVGRSFNISGCGLNQYLIVLARTGSGKEGAATGIDTLTNAVRLQVPMIDEFMGPGAFASGQALIRVLDKNPCFVSVLGEFGLTLQQLCSPNANSAQVMLKKVLLDIYAKSGQRSVLQSSVYSEADKNTKRIQAPNVTILGESTPETFYSGLDAGAIAEGLIPRFSIFEYNGPRADTNPNAFCAPPDELVRRFGGLAAVAMGAQQSRTFTNVEQSPEAKRLLREFDRHATQQINANNADVNRQLWNRAHLKALKMSALISVGENPHRPVISKAVAEWSVKVINRDISALLRKFESGEVGTGDVRLELDVRRAISAYILMSAEERKSYGCPERMATLPLVPFHYLRRRLRLLVSFKNDRRGANSALSQTLSAMTDGEVLTRLSPVQTRDQCGTNSPVYGLGPAW